MSEAREDVDLVLVTMARGIADVSLASVLPADAARETPVRPNLARVQRFDRVADGGTSWLRYDQVDGMLCFHQREERS